MGDMILADERRVCSAGLGLIKAEYRGTMFTHNSQAETPMKTSGAAGLCEQEYIRTKALPFGLLHNA